MYRNVETCYLYKDLFMGASFLSLGFLKLIKRCLGYHWSIFNLVGMVSVVELKQSSVMQRLLIGWMPTAIR